ncbi:MAG: S41 family peptidase [Acidobacteriota bacterium]
MRGRSVFLVLSIVVALVLVAFATGAAEVASKGLVRLAALFGQSLSLIRSNYVEEVPVETLELGAMTGLVEGADPGGSWVPNGSERAFAALGVRQVPAYGLVLGKRASYPVALQVLPGSPAERAGIVPGEMFERLGGEPVRARPLWRARVLLDEAEQRGADVPADVIDRGFEGKRRVTLHAAPATVPAASVTDREGVPVVRVARLDEAAARQIEEAFAAHADAASIVVEARGTALGDVAGAARVAAVLAGGEVSVSLARKEGKGEVVTAKAPERRWRVIVCVDATTAGPAEALVVALKSKGATLVGLESYGDTGLRKPVKAGGGQLWLAESWCAGPDGKPVLGDGVKPDEVVRPRREGDAILDRAVELARGDVKDKAA